MSDLPPPIINPPTPPPAWNPPPAPKSAGTRNLFIALGICCLLCLGGMVGGFFWIRNVANKPITAPPGGAPVVKSTLPDGWCVVSYPAVPLTVNLPASPKSEIFEGDDVPLAAKMLLDYATIYSAIGEETSVTMSSFWMNAAGRPSVRANAIDSFATEFAESMVPGKSERVTVLGAPTGSVARHSVGEEQLSIVNLFVPCPAGVVVFSTYAENKTQAIADAERLARTIRLE